MKNFNAKQYQNKQIQNISKYPIANENEQYEAYMNT